MANDIPADVLRNLEKSGFSFGEDGEIKEDKFLTDEIIEDVDDELDEQDTDDEQDRDETSDDDADVDEDDADDEDDEDEDEDEPKRTGLTLTSRGNDDDDVEDPIKSMKKTQDELLERVRKLAEKNKADDQVDEEEPASDDASELRAEAAKFKQMRLQMFAKEIERDVNSLDLGAKFKDIISSKEWDTYLKSKAYGQTIGSLYVDSIKNNEGDDVVSFFKDFTDRYLPSVSKSQKVSEPVKKAVKPKSKKASLDDLAVPDKTKTSKVPLRKSKFDFVDQDYVDMLNKAERGKITHSQFVTFEDKFNKALEKGRVKSTS